MTVVALRLGGPLQSWGSSQRLDHYRRTERFPTKSAVLGLVAAALGRGRSDPVDDLVALGFGVRIDRPGEVLRDFHTLSSLFDDKGHFAPERGRLPNASGGYRSPETSTRVTVRHYLADACFVVGIEGEPVALGEIDEALRRPVFPLYLGRRSCPPDAPVRLGLHQGTLVDVLAALPWQGGASGSREQPRVRCELVIEDPDGTREQIDDVRSFDPVFRSYGRRRVRHEYVDVPNPKSESLGVGAAHDPMALLEGP
jgi:CRISPR system Cascade subunit CasD